MQTKIYELKLHETVKEGDFKITRVPKGWIYLQIVEGRISAVFVPFHDEFKNAKSGFDLR